MTITIPYGMQLEGRVDYLLDFGKDDYGFVIEDKDDDYDDEFIID